VYEVITKQEEASLVRYLDPLLLRKRYEGDHWDAVISKYKEIDLANRVMPIDVQATLERVSSLVQSFYHLTEDSTKMMPLHVIDLAEQGYIAPHVDSIKHSGAILSGLSLLSSRVMLLSDENAETPPLRLLLPERSLYVLEGPLRYTYKHAILGKGEQAREANMVDDRIDAKLERRLSIIFRDEPFEPSQQEAKAKIFRGLKPNES